MPWIINRKAGRRGQYGPRNRGLRVSLVIHALGAGGAEKVITLLANEWVRRGTEVSLICFDNQPPYFPLDPQVRLHQLQTPSLQGASFLSLYYLIRRVISLRRAIRTHQSDVVISFLTKINVVSALANIGLESSLVLSERNNPNLQEFNLFWRSLRSVAYRLCDRIVVMTNGANSHFPVALRNRLRTIPNPVQPVNGQFVPKQDRKRVIAAGRLVYQKGFDLLLQAFAKVAESHPDWDLLIFGEGYKRQDLISARNHLGLENRVSFPGVTEKPGEWTAEGEIFVLSSRFEGFANVICEAMSAGMTVVSFDCPWGPSEIIQHDTDGILVPAENVDALATAMERVLTDPALRLRLGKAAQKSVMRFSVPVVLDRWDQMLTEITQSGRDLIESERAS